MEYPGYYFREGARINLLPSVQNEQRIIRGGALISSTNKKLQAHQNNRKIEFGEQSRQKMNKSSILIVLLVLGGAFAANNQKNCRVVSKYLLRITKNDFINRNYKF